MKNLSILTVLTVTTGITILSGCSVPKSSVTSSQAKVLKVYTTTDGDYKFNAYVIKRNGTEVVVSDSLGRTDHKVGDTITYMDQKVEVGDTKMMVFTAVK